MVQTNKNKGPDTHASGNNKADFDTNILSLNAEQILDGLYHILHKLWLQGRRIVYHIMGELGGNEFVEAATSWCMQHPDIAICVVAASFVFLLPLLIIIGFGIVTMVVTFTGILVLEGTLLTIFIMIFLAFIGSWAIAVTVFAIVAYFGFAQIYGFFGLERHRDAFKRFIKQNISRENATERVQDPSN